MGAARGSEPQLLLESFAEVVVEEVSDLMLAGLLVEGHEALGREVIFDADEEERAHDALVAANGGRVTTLVDSAPTLDALPSPINWAEFWRRDRKADDFLVEPILARG